MYNYKACWPYSGVYQLIKPLLYCSIVTTVHLMSLLYICIDRTIIIHALFLFFSTSVLTRRIKYGLNRCTYRLSAVSSIKIQWCLFNPATLVSSQSGRINQLAGLSNQSYIRVFSVKNLGNTFA